MQQFFPYFLFFQPVKMTGNRGVKFAAALEAAMLSCNRHALP